MSLDTGEVLGATVQELGRIVGVDRCFFRSAGDPSTGVLGPIEYEWDAPGMESLHADPERQYPVASLAAMTGTTQWSNDVTQDDRLLDGEVPGTVHDLMDTNTRSALSAPLRWGDELLGVVTLLCAAPRNWSSLDVELIEAAANEASVALHHAHLYAKAVETATELERLDELRRDFISMISHELRSPMTVVAGIADLFQKHWERLSDENRKELVDTLGRESRRLTRLVTEVLDLEAIDGGRVDLLVEEVNLAALTGESIVDGGQAGQAHLVGGGGDATVQADRDRIKQVLLNLLSNAAKFSSEGSPITVEVVPEDDSVCVSVTDQGPGIAEEDMPRLFQRFSRLQSPVPQPGSGLGLYLSRVLINRHGGDIWVDSEPDEGSTFTFRLPRRPPA
jgi:signal transduction histidine kinase